LEKEREVKIVRMTMTMKKKEVTDKKVNQKDKSLMKTKKNMERSNRINKKKLIKKSCYKVIFC
jgi:hypothetical protein